MATETTASPPSTDEGPHLATRWSLVAGAALIGLASFLHFSAWLSLAFPAIFEGWGIAQFGRLKPVADAVLIYGGLLFVNTGALYHLIPRLLGAPLRDGALARANVLWTLLVGTASVLAIGFGFGDGRPGFEFPLVLDAIYLTVLVAPLWITRRALKERTEASLYPTIWALVAAFLALGTAVVVANFPLTEATGAWIQVGFGRGLLLWTWAIGSGVGVAWYVVPKATGRPLFSRQLAQITFISLLLPPMLIGLGGLMFGPMPDWAEVIGVTFRFTLVVPAVAVAAGLLATINGADDEDIKNSVVVRTALAGAWLLAGGGLAAALSAFPSVQAVIAFTTFDDGTTALLVGSATLFAASFIYHALPEETGTRLFSVPLGFAHIRLVLWGSATTALLLWLAGVAAGIGFRTGALTGQWEAVGEGFATAAGGIAPILMLALIAMALTGVGQLAFAWNVLRTNSPPPASSATTQEETP